MNLIQKILEEALTDTDDSDHQSDLVIELYQNATQEERKVLDELLVCICGWELKSLLKMMDNLEHF